MPNFSRMRIVGGLCGGLGLLLLAVTLVMAQQSEQSDQSAHKVATLQEQLEKGLRAQRPIEFQFIGRVVQLVNQGRLNRVAVLGTFNYVTKKYRDRKYMVSVFEQVLRKRLAQDGNNALNNVPTTLTIVQQ